MSPGPTQERKTEKEVNQRLEISKASHVTRLSGVSVVLEFSKSEERRYLFATHPLPPQKNTNNITPKCPVQVKHYFIKITAFWGYILVPSSHTISPRVFVCVSPTCTCVSAICSNTVGPTILIEVSKERFYCPGCVVTHRNCLT